MDGSNASSIPRQRQAQPNMIYSTDLEAEQGVGYGVDPRGKMPQAANVPHNNGAQPWMFVPTSWSADAVGPPPSRSVGPPTQHVPGGVGPGSIGWGVAPNHALRGLVAESSHDASSHASSLEDIGNDFDPEKTIQFDARLPKRLHQTEEERLRGRIQELEGIVAAMRGGYARGGGREERLEEELRAGREREEELRRRLDYLQSGAERSVRLVARLEEVLKGRVAIGVGAHGLASAEAFVEEMEREVRASAAATP